MSELITTLHPQDDNSVNLYPNVKLENIVDGKAEDAGKFVKVNEEGKFIVETVNIPEPQQVNNSTVTIKQGGADKGSFTLNQAEDATIELDAGGGSNMYATSSAISKGIPAHKEAANPIQVGDTISQLYFNTQQDIKPYLETCVDWNNGNKIINEGDGTLVYPLLTGVGDENAAGFRELKNFDYIYGLKIKADYEPGDGKVDPELNAWLADILTSLTSVDLFYVQSTNSSGVGLKASKKETGSGTEYILSCTEYVGTIIYSSIDGFKSGTGNWDSSKHAYKLVYGDDDKEAFITGLDETYSAGWNGVFFGAVSNLGEIILSIIKIVSSSEMPYELYMLTSNGLSVLSSDSGLFDSLYYVSAPFPGPDNSVIKSGWHVTADQAVALSKPETVTTVSDVVSKIASSEANWVSVPEVLGSIYQDNILGTDEVKINDILVDTTGTLGKVKEFSEESFKNQHPANPFAVGDEIPANSYVYIDTSITPDLSKLDWSGFDPSGSGALFPLAPLESFVLTQFTQFMALGGLGIKLNKPIYALTIGDNNCSYFQVDPSDVDKVLSSSLFKYFTGGVNKWTFASDVVTHEGSIFKVPLENAETVTLTDINDQDVWGAFISKDGRWVEDTPISRTKVSCEALRQLPTNYDNLDGIPILKLDYVIDGAEGYEFIPGNYENKYIQDPTGIIYFCDGRDLHQLKGGKERTININARDGLKNYGTSISPSIYSVDIGLTDTSSGTYTGDVDSTYTEVLTRHNPSSGTADSYTWRSIKAIQPEILAGNGISKSGNTVSLASDVRERLIPPTDGLDSLYRYHLVLPDSTKLSSIFWEKTKSTSIGTGLVEEPTNPSDQTLKIGLSSSDLDYTQPNTKVYAKNTNSNTFGWVSLPSQSSTSVQAGSGINVSGNTVSLTSEYANRSISSANSGMYVMARDGSTMNQIGWSSVSIPRGVKAGTGLVSDTYDSYTDTLSLSQDVQDSLAKANSALQESALSGYATTSQVDAKYTKPAAGIPETDLSADIQSALTKANSSISGVKVNGTQVTVTDGVADIGTVITAHQSLDGKQDKLNDAQLTAVNSGITSGKVSTYDGYATSIQTLTTNLSSSDAKITQNTADITELKTTTVKKADMKGLELPDLPSADGNYALTCTITGGVPTFAWTLATN